MTNRLKLTLVALFAVTACGKKMTPLTAEQKVEFQNSLNGVAGPLTAAKAKDPAIRAMMALSAAKPSKPVKPAADDDYIPSTLETEFDTNCDASYSFSGAGLDTIGLTGNIKSPMRALALMGQSSQKPSLKQPKPAEAGAYSLDVKAAVKNKEGLVCPLVLDVAVALTMPTETSADISLTASFEIQNEELKAAQDITKFTITGNGSASGTESSIKADFSATGALTSTKNGEVAFYTALSASGSQSSAEGEVKMGMTFKDYTAELKVTLSGNAEKQDVKYFLNDEEITETEFMAFFDRFENLNETTPSAASRGPISGDESFDDSFDDIVHP